MGCTCEWDTLFRGPSAIFEKVICYDFEMSTQRARRSGDNGSKGAALKTDDITVSILREIRDGISGLSTRVDETNARLDVTNERVDEVRRQQIASEMRLATATAEVAMTMREVGERIERVLREETRTIRRLDRCEERLSVLERKTG